MKETPMRRTPQQVRSQRRVSLILDTAADLFAEVGYEPATTNSIAERAGISIGSLYRYFSDKDAILRALTERHREQVRGIFDNVFSGDLVYLPLDVLLDRLIDPFVELHTACPAYKQILLGSDVSADMAAANEESDQEIVRRMAEVLQLTAPGMDAERAHLVATVCKAQVKALLSLVGSSDDREFQSQVTAEVKRMLLGYLAPFFSEDRHG
jgi:AcrR family transcriptional regulator